jgi:hypothetical protein
VPWRLSFLNASPIGARDLPGRRGIKRLWRSSSMAEIIARVCTWYKCFRYLISSSSYGWDCIISHHSALPSPTGRGPTIALAHWAAMPSGVVPLHWTNFGPGTCRINSNLTSRLLHGVQENVRHILSISISISPSTSIDLNRVLYLHQQGLQNARHMSMRSVLFSLQTGINPEYQLFRTRGPMWGVLGPKHR